MSVVGSGASFLLGSNVVAKLKTISNPLTNETLDVTTFDSSAFKEFLAGLTEGTVSITGDYDSTDTNGQIALITAFLAKTLLTSTQKPKILWNGVNGMTADGYCTELNMDTDVAALVNFAATIKMTGTIAVV